MKIKISEIVRKVYMLLDENETIIEERVEYCDPGAYLGNLIKEFLPDAALAVLSTVSSSRIDELGHLQNIKASTEPIPTIELPSDFLRLIYVRMEDWISGVTAPLAFGGEDYLLRCRRYRINGHRQIRPAAAIRLLGDEKQLEIFGSSPGNIVKHLYYVKKPTITDKCIDLPPGIVQDVCETIAKRVRDNLNL